MDHVALGHVTSVKDQASCGSCWAFATTAAVEGEYSLATGKLRPLAEQELLDCARPARGCRGGWLSDTYNYITSHSRLGLQSECPYRASKGLCEYSDKTNGLADVWVGGYVEGPRGDGNLESALVDHVIAASIYASSAMMSYSRGVFGGCVVPPMTVNHGVGVVGYGPGYWKVKNSWGVDWGETGYVRLSRDIANNCCISDSITYPVLYLDPHPWLAVPKTSLLPARYLSRPDKGRELRVKFSCLPAGGANSHISVLMVTAHGYKSGTMDFNTPPGDGPSRFSLSCWDDQGAWRRTLGRSLTSTDVGECGPGGFREVVFSHEGGLRYRMEVGSWSEVVGGSGRCAETYNRVQITGTGDAFYTWRH